MRKRTRGHIEQKTQWNLSNIRTVEKGKTMRKSQKLMLISLLIAVIATIVIVPSLSWLSSVSKPVVNTFSGGAISILLDEAKLIQKEKQLWVKTPAVLIKTTTSM